MADYACIARDAGATIIGGCCGTQPHHLEIMKEALETRPRNDRPTLEQITNVIGPFSSESDGTGDQAGGEDAGGRRRSRRRRT